MDLMAWFERRGFVPFDPVAVASIKPFSDGAILMIDFRSGVLKLSVLTGRLS